MADVDTPEILRKLQQLVQAKAVTVVGSGLSCAEGLPGMGDLEMHLREEVPPLLASDGERNSWAQVCTKLDEGATLEPALDVLVENDPVNDKVIESTAQLIRQEEQKAVEEVLAGTRELRFSKLVPYVALDARTHVITTNYDRLLEFAIELSDIQVDTGSLGKVAGRHDFMLSSQEQYQIGSTLVKASELKRKRRKHMVVFKPHGSLDWVPYKGVARRISLSTSTQPLMITPGRAKYRAGYEKPFEEHRTKANAAIRRAGNLLFVGYGFNDDHLEVEVRESFERGVPALVLSRTLTNNAREMIKRNPSAIGAERYVDGEKPGTKIVTADGESDLPGKDWWDLGIFVDEVLR